MKKVALILFLAASVIELACQVMDLRELHHIIKPMLMIFLGAYYFFSVSASERSWLILMAMLFSFLGDSFLLYEENNSLYFILGLLSFLIAHLFYILIFRQFRSGIHEDQLATVQKARMAFPVILAATGLVVVLYPRLGDLRFPVIVYAAVLMFMVLNALFRFQRTSPASFWMVSSGAVLFMISDSILAINKFLSPVSNAGVWIMLFYLSGQFLIILGLLKHDRE
jgi:uncharacterized membrane protein YhhN